MSARLKKICVMGLGYIGLPTASLLGTKGYDVHGVDISQDVVDTINDGRIHIVEPDLDIMVKSAVQSGHLKADIEPCVADVFIIAVPTPFKEGKKPDLTYVAEATKKISSYVKPGDLVILESTSPVGTTDEVVAKILKEDGHRDDVFVAHCPERVLPGRILIELVENDRVVGGINEESTQQAVDFYEDFVRGEVLSTTAKTAEMVKLTENSSRDVQIAFANELSMICESETINTWEVIELANRHPRVNILKPGPGVGGHCIAVDPWFIVDRSPEHSHLIRTAREVNDAKPEWVIERVKRCADKFKDPVIACLGLAFKADVDDLRESPAFDIVKRLQADDVGNLLICEPNLKESSEFELCSVDEAIRHADIVLLLVDHKKFKNFKAAELGEKVVIDTRGIIK
ncbi:UDP-N-acetyl-D-mannosaminuronic acid dehydrogenase [Sinobacterium caligoides]|uniref:UDP-N-acetyl-D-mannosaminuronic acid dehydrogenase n=1 Tax=Sinobacterium caligoides TaxID=933926 RepID=A0A3N2DYX9_9GAMM|nr:UDP-N-acetyl-D-mannosamine dehydrogenase [Sinobacterium caligoides]ROS05053.1 UDP-N-acetyl-D-mannosaminuronic acid dehydrogenase [Sinobacterium caligoides]